MLKKAAHISLVILLLLSTMGVTMYKHYCGSSYIRQSINILPDNCCKGHCPACHNETKQFKVTDSFEANDAKFNFKTEISKIFNHTNFAIALLITTFQENVNDNLNYKVKTCENSLPTQESHTAFLQVFRL